MIEKNPDKDLPGIHNTAYIHPSAIIIGNVKIGKRVFIGPGAVVRADEPGSLIIIHKNCNIQDSVVIHALSETTVVVDKNTSLAHGCVVHGPCKIGQGCFIGFGAVIFNAILADEVIVKHLVVIEGVEISPKKLILNGTVIDSEDKVKELEPVTKELKTFSQKVITANLDLVKRYKNGS